ncbi:MAG: hypothetical protein HOO91_01945 [Bacteroidales bacterium]|nr:hypothetical protein [Bacteroidales bacterium]
MKRISIIILSIGLVLHVKAQSELTLPFLRDVFQSSYINPTVLPEHTVSLGLPGMSSVYGQVIQNGLVLKDFTDFRNDTTHINPNKLLAGLSDKNLIYTGTTVDIFHLRIKVRNGYYWIGIRNNLNLGLQYPKSLMSLIINGNKQFIGNSLDLSNTRVDVTLYNEYSFGMAKELNRWVFGGRVSLLQGLSNVQFEPKSFNISIDNDMYVHTAEADVKMNTAGIPKNSKGDFSFDHAQDITYLTNYFSNFNNKGVSLSAGVTYKLDDKTRFSAAFSDLGYINWKDSVTNYTMKGTTNFGGVDMLTGWLYNNEINTDSLINKMKDDFVRDTIHSNYRTYLHPKFLVSASYDIFRRTTIGISATGVYNKKLYPAFTLGLSQGLGRFLNLISTISYNQKTINNLGVGLVIKPGPMQIYIIADNVYPAINPLYTTNVNFRFGVNLVFGRVKSAVGLPYR